MLKLFRMLLKHKFLILLFIIICISRSFVVLFLNRGYAGLINSVLSGKYEQIQRLSGTLLFTGLIQMVVIMIQNQTTSLLSEKIGAALRLEAFHGILRAKYHTIEHLNTGESLTKLNTDLNDITLWIRNDLNSILSEGILFIIVFVAMLYMNIGLTTISYFTVPLLAVVSFWLSRPITQSETIKMKAASDVTVLAKSMVDAFPILKVYPMKGYIMKLAEERIHCHVKAEVKVNHIRARLMSINGFLSYLPLIILWGTGGYKAIKGEISAGALLAFINMSGFITGPLLNLPARINSIRTSKSHIVRVLDLISSFEFISKGGGKMTQDIGQKIAVEFRNVTFSYSDKLCLNKISFKIHQGSHIAILGESGCGKSTVLKLIMGLYQVCSGEVLVFGKDIKTSDLNQIRNLISYVPQDPHLFPISILENITCGHPMDHGQIIEACKAAQLNDFINSLPDGLNTNIGEYGNRLSGGERQRISIARAIAKNAPIYLLDEATSSLDGHTEQSILNYFHTNASERTVIFVTHRIKNTLDSNLVICIKNGEIYEVGTPDMLLKTEGYYARLYRIQSLMEVCSNE